MFDLKLLSNVSKVEKETGKKISVILAKVPFRNVVIAFKVIPVDTLVAMVRGVSVDKLVMGLQIITPKEIEEIDSKKLLIVLLHGNMNTVQCLQNKYGEDTIISVIRSLSFDRLERLLKEDNFDVICSIIESVQEGR